MPAGDELRYTTPAVNLLAGRGFSSAVSEPYTPSEATVPGYPLFIAVIMPSSANRIPLSESRKV